MPDAGLANILAFKRNQTLRRCAEDAVKQTAKELDLPKNVVYDIALKEE